MHTAGFYTTPGPLTSAGQYAKLLDDLPRELAALTKAIQGLTIHEYLTSHYGVEFSEERKLESHLRALPNMLRALLGHDDRPLSTARAPEQRLCGVCRHFVLLLTAALRHQGVPARARVGFGTYFNPGTFEDHWLCEYWDAAQSRWALVDPQLDDVLRKALKLDFDPLDVPRDRFVIAYDAWQQCRAGRADPSLFGLSLAKLSGSWFVTGNLIRDLAALNGMEILPWDVWGGMTREELSADQLAFFDRIAALTREPEASFAELRDWFQSDDRLRVCVGDRVWNARLERADVIEA